MNAMFVSFAANLTTTAPVYDLQSGEIMSPKVLEVYKQY